MGCQGFAPKQDLSLGNYCANDVGTPVHEIMHALGTIEIFHPISFYNRLILCH